jgi:excinuclease ABC subunit C
MNCLSAMIRLTRFIRVLFHFMSKSNEEYLQSLVKVLPNKPGVYQYFDKEGTIIYVGKAKDLRKRVSSYFVKSHDSAKTRILVRRIADIKHIVVETETDALLLENNLIKKYQPRYNVMLKDDKSYPWIVVKREPFPRVFYTRNVIKDGSKYYGPFTSVTLVKTIIELFKQIYQLRTCKLYLSNENITAGKFKVCLEYHIGNCLGPCVGEQSEDDYNEGIDHIHHILKGNIGSVIQILKNRMNQYSEDYEFEKAQRIKERLLMLENYQSKSMVVNATISDVDVYSIADDENFAYINFLKVVNGAIIQVHTIEMKKKLNETKEELLPLGIVAIREKFFSVSKEVIVPFHIDYQIDNVKFIVPVRGDKKKLLELSEKNVKFYRLEKLKHIENVDPQKHTKRILNTLKTDLRLQELPVHIECFDNSNIQGSNPVAACVVFKNAKPASKEYRHFNIKTVEGPDDFASMEEVIYRRYKRMLEEEKDLPQLIIIDGGKGQLSSAVKSLDKLNLRGRIAIIGIAKKLEEIYFPGDSVPLYLDKNSESLKVIQYARNEAHRFGITFHRNQRSKNFITSDLDQIKGIGEKTKEILFAEFGTLKKIKEAGLDKLSEKIGASKAKIIVNHFSSKK